MSQRCGATGPAAKDKHKHCCVASARLITIYETVKASSSLELIDRGAFYVSNQLSNNAIMKCSRMMSDNDLLNGGGA